MTYDIALDQLARGEIVFCLGQFDRRTKAKLDRLAKRGRIFHYRCPWPFVYFGTAQKTAYSLNPIPGLEAR